jgi:exopolysaccharide biosynthesis polyprenyl glycosylphosphotransferase
LEALIDRCHKEGIRTRVDLGFFPRTFPRVHVENLRHIPLLTLGSTPDNELALFAKRTADLLVSAVTLIVLAPLMLVLGLLVRLSSPGPVLYKQIRCGLNGRRFALYKFRSMVANADELRSELEAFNEVDGAAFKIKNDPRCTPLGRWMRKFSLDELPQLWNVLKGEMSLVGPRPHPLDDFAAYEIGDLARLDVTPGITGLWQVTARRDPSFQRGMDLDREYIGTWSLAQDLRIIFRTVLALIQGSGD